MELKTISEALTVFSTVDWTGILLLFLIVVMSAILWRLNKSPSTQFFYDDLFVDESGRSSTSKLASIIALTLSSWAFVHLALKNNLTEWYFMTYMGIWVLNRGYSKWIDLKRDIPKELINKPEGE